MAKFEEQAERKNRRRIEVMTKRAQKAKKEIIMCSLIQELNSLINSKWSKCGHMPSISFTLEQKEKGIKIMLRPWEEKAWIVSVDSDKPLECEYFEGIFYHIPDFSRIKYMKSYESYEKNNSKFTEIIQSDYKLYTFFFLLRHLSLIAKFRLF